MSSLSTLMIFLPERASSSAYETMMISASSACGPKALSFINWRSWEKKNIHKTLGNICLLFWHFNSCWTWLSHAFVILGRHDSNTHSGDSVVVPPYGHNIRYKSCCTFTVRMSGSTGSISSTHEYLKSTYLLDLRRQTAMLIHEHAWDCTQLICARPNCRCWPSVKSTRKISSSPVTCLVLLSYCTSWWHSFDQSACGIMESSDSIEETVFP